MGGNVGLEEILRFANWKNSDVISIVFKKFGDRSKVFSGARHLMIEVLLLDCHFRIVDRQTFFKKYKYTFRYLKVFVFRMKFHLCIFFRSIYSVCFLLKIINNLINF